MKVLFIPAFDGGKSHQIPLYALYHRYFSRIKNMSTAFLLPASDHADFKLKNINVLDINYGLEENESTLDNEKIARCLIRQCEKAINHFCPDIIVEDFDFFSGLLSERYMIPRISIKRTGLFRSSSPFDRNSNHIHSVEKDPLSDKIVKILGYKELSGSEHAVIPDERYYLPEIISWEDFPNSAWKSNANIIPAIATIERLPAVAIHTEYFYCGPLIAKDKPSEILTKKLAQFFDQNRNRKKVFVTTGLIEKQDMSEILDCLLARNYAVITTAPYKHAYLNSCKLFINPTLPLDTICSTVDLIVHHCGSGMYHYPLLNQKPTITLGTRCYDREDVALQLQSLGISRHTPSPYDDPLYLETFKLHLEKFETGTLCDFIQLEKIKEEIIDTMLSFDIQKVLDSALTDN